MRPAKAIAITGYTALIILTGYAATKSGSFWVVAFCVFISQFSLCIGYVLGSLHAVPRINLLKDIRQLVESSSRAVLSYLDRFSQQNDRIESGIQVLSDRLQAQQIDQFAASDRMRELAEQLRARKAIDPDKGVVEEILLLLGQAHFSVAKKVLENGVCPCCGQSHDEYMDEELFFLRHYHGDDCPIPKVIDLCSHIEAAACSSRQ